jgi:hypothetical protein
MNFQREAVVWVYHIVWHIVSFGCCASLEDYLVAELSFVNTHISNPTLTLTPFKMRYQFHWIGQTLPHGFVICQQLCSCSICGILFLGLPSSEMVELCWLMTWA